MGKSQTYVQTSKKGLDGKVKESTRERSSHSSPSQGQYIAIGRDWQGYPQSDVDLKRKYQRQMAEAMQHMERASAEKWSPAKSWEMETQQQSSWNAAGAFESFPRREKTKPKKRAESDDQWSTAGTDGSRRE